MKAKILKLGHAAFVVDISPGSTVQDALNAANLRTEGYTLSLDGLGCTPEAVLSDSSVVTLLPKVVGGHAA